MGGLLGSRWRAPRRDRRGRGLARGPRGFTLLELLITLGVTTIGLVGLLALHLSIVRGNDGADRSAEAQQVGATTLESLRAQRVSDMMTTLTGDPNPALPTKPYVTMATGRGGLAYRVTTTVDTPPGAPVGLLRIRVLTEWTEGGGKLGDNPQLDHALPLEVIRTQQEAL
jgi:prepilin-type N-terminal cleavage/methylation domain-containing protein